MGEVIPELDVLDIERSRLFYTGVIGAHINFERPEEKFCFFDINGAHLMIEEAAGPGRRFRTAALEYPYGRGINIQIKVPDVDLIYARALVAGSTIVLPLEERWYRKGDVELGNRQFVVADPDGYLLRPYTDLGNRPCGDKI